MLHYSNTDCYQGLLGLPADSVHACVTDIPYFGLCDYYTQAQFGLETLLDDYLTVMAAVFEGVFDALIDGGVFYCIVGDTSNNYSPIRGRGQRRKLGEYHHRRKIQPHRREKEALRVPNELIEVARRIGFADRMDLIWHKPACGARPKADAPGLSHCSILFLVKSEGRRPTGICKALRSSVLTHAVVPHPSHPCKTPPALFRELLESVAAPGRVIVDPFAGTGTCLLEAEKLGMHGIGFELSEAFYEEAQQNHPSLNLSKSVEHILLPASSRELRLAA